MESLKQTPKEGFGAKIRGGLLRLGHYIKETASAGPKRVPAGEIDQPTVAKIIIHDILAEGTRLGDRSSIPFSHTTLLASLGHVVLFNSDDPKEKFPKEYAALREQLDSLIQGGVLQRVPLKATDSHKESFYYQITDKEALKKMASTT